MIAITVGWPGNRITASGAGNRTTAMEVSA